MEAARLITTPPSNIRAEQEVALVPRAILNEVGAALRTYYDSEVAAGASRQFDHHLAALDRVDELHRSGVDAVRRSLEQLT
jgi:hypothetical protein